MLLTEKQIHHRRKEHVKISNTATFYKVGQTHAKLQKTKCVTVVFVVDNTVCVSYFRVLQMSATLRVFGTWP